VRDHLRRGAKRSPSIEEVGPHEHASTRVGSASCGLIVICLTGDVSQRSRSFVDADVLLSDIVAREHRVLASDEWLIVGVSQIPGFDVVGCDAFEQASALHVSRRRISARGSGATQFKGDVARYGLGADRS